MDPVRPTIRLVEIVSEKSPRPPRKDAWRVKWAVGDDAEHPVLEGTWYVEKDWLREDGLVLMTRNWFHHLCAQIAEETQDWIITQEQADSFAVEASTDQSPSTDAKGNRQP